MKIGYVIDGKYYEDEPTELTNSLIMSPMYRQADHEMQRQDHQRDLLQPYKPDGSINEEFMEAYPDQAKLYRQGEDNA
jgi:hypothetical protein